MKITQEDLAVIVDTMRNSCRIAYSQEHLFSYKRAEREKVAIKLIKELSKSTVQMVFEDEE